MENNTFDKLPKKFQENMSKLLGDKIGLYKKVMSEKHQRGIRINPLKTNYAHVLQMFDCKLEKVPYEENGYVFDSDEKVGNLPEHISGMIYAQEPSSMMPVNAVKIPDDAIVLDMCAAPGGKSTQIAQRIPSGVLVSNEIVLSRAKILYSNIERLGEINTIVTNETPKGFAEKMPCTFDYVFVDAPCSGEGMFRKDPDTISEWSNENIVANSKRQLEILECADKCLKTGGKIVYSTCTFSETENENVILKFLENHDYEVIPAEKEVSVWTAESTIIKGARRFYPFSGKGEGQFVCVIKKRFEDGFCKNHKTKIEFLQKKDEKLVREFLTENFDIPFSFELVVLHGTVHLVNEKMTKLLGFGVNTISAGVKICTIEKGVIKPHHALFSCLGRYAKYKFELEGDNFFKYVHGEELDAGECKNKMFYTMSYKGASVGGGKCTQGKMKNLFPKGLRL